QEAPRRVDRTAHRTEQPVTGAHGAGEALALAAQPAPVGRVRRVAAHAGDAAGAHGGEDAAPHPAVGTDGGALRGRARRHRPSTRTTTSPSTTCALWTRTASSQSVTAPVRRSTTRPCSGQVTVSPATMPSASGPSAWGQRPPTTRTVSPHRKTANSSPSTTT